MIQGGNVTVYVSDINVAIDFYTQTLGLELRMRAEDHWAEIEAGPGLIIGLHPASEHGPQPGSRGALSIGLNVSGTLEEEVEALTRKGVAFQGPIVDDEQVRLAFFADPDGNPLYLCQVLYAGAHGGPEQRR
jgi:catechol 2,3-dioxygenase-like lactoylglutathione lyase family enzyme